MPRTSPAGDLAANIGRVASDGWRGGARTLWRLTWSARQRERGLYCTLGPKLPELFHPFRLIGLNQYWVATMPSKFGEQGLSGKLVFMSNSVTESASLTGSGPGCPPSTRKSLRGGTAF